MSSTFKNLTELEAELKKRIATYNDFPKSGVNFKDIQSILSDSILSRQVLDGSVDLLWQMGGAEEINAVLGFDARGFLFGFPIALEFGIPLILARKQGKLPGEIVTVSFQKEYGTDTLSVQQGLITPGMKVLVHDDLLATGGTALAAVELIRNLKGVVAGFHFIMELGYLGAREKLEPHAPVLSMVNFKTPEE